MTEKISIVLGNPLVNYKGLYYSGKMGCSTEVGGAIPADLTDVTSSREIVSCDTPLAIGRRSPDDIFVLNRQASAIESGLLDARRCLVEALFRMIPDGGKPLEVIVNDVFAISDFLKRGEFHPKFPLRFNKLTLGKNLDDCAVLISRLRDALEQALGEVKLFVQLDHPAQVHDFLSPSVYSSLMDPSNFGSHNAFKKHLLSEEGLRKPFTLADLHPILQEPYNAPLTTSPFALSQIYVLFERTLRDVLKRLAVSADWDSSVNISDQTRRPFFEPEPGEIGRNVINFVPRNDSTDNHGFHVVPACMGVVAAVPLLVSHVHSDSQLKMFMEADTRDRRVDPKIMRGGLNFYLENIATLQDEDLEPFVALPEAAVVPHLFMTAMQTSPVDLSLSK